MALNRVWIPSPNHSGRGGAGVRLIVLHTAEGARTIESLGNFFASSSSGVSSHTGADDKLNTVGEYVSRVNKAWTQGNANPVAVSIELCAFAAWPTSEWDKHPNMLDNCAKWIAEEAAAFGVPIRRLSPAEAQGNGRGVCQHIDLGSWGGGHVDCGSAFPMDRVLAMASGQAPTEPTPAPEEPDMKPAPLAFVMDDVDQMFYVDEGGGLIHCYAGPGKAWVKENLGGGWDPDSGLSHNVSAGGPDQVWGIRRDGKRAQCYWSGRQWVTHPMP